MPQVKSAAWLSIEGGWASPSCNSTTDALELYKESGGVWSSEVIDDQSGAPDRCRMAVDGNDLMIVDRILSRAAWQQYFYDGETMTWDIQPIFQPQGVFSQRMDVAALGGSFFVLYDDQLLDEVHCAEMVPPAS